MSLFNFALKPAARCVFPDARQGKRRVSWFWLTDCHYFIDLGQARLFESSREAQIRYGMDSPYDDYYYVRQLEDLFDALPGISCPIPDDLFRLVDSGAKHDALSGKCKAWLDDIDFPDEERESAFDALCQLTSYGVLDTGYLRFKSFCAFHHIGRTIRIIYDFRDADEEGIPVWSAGAGSHELPYQDFLGEIEDMLARFFAAMDRQVADVVSLLPDEIGYELIAARDEKKGIVKTGAEYLLEEREQRRKFFWDILERMKNGGILQAIDWDGVRKAVHYLERHSAGK
jgi:hypothetical protein